MAKHQNGELLPSVAQRIADCNTYHMPVDGVIREFYDHMTEAAAQGIAVAFDQLFSGIESTQRSVFLRELYNTLPPEEKLHLVVRLTGDMAIQETLRGFVERESAYDRVLLLMKAEAERYGYFYPEAIPQDAEVVIYMAEQSRVDECQSDAEISGLDYDRSLTVRAVGDGHFKILAEDCSESADWPEKEGFGVNDIISFGTSVKKNKRMHEPVCRFTEGLAVTRSDKKTVFLSLVDRRSNEMNLVVIHVLVDDDGLLPFNEIF